MRWLRLATGLMTSETRKGVISRPVWAVEARYGDEVGDWSIGREGGAIGCRSVGGASDSDNGRGEGVGCM